MSRAKGDRRENQAEEIYEAAGYKVEKSVGQRWDRTDWFGHFDLMAVRPDGLRYSQVKSNEARGIQSIIQWAQMWAPSGVRFDMLICHDREGWRLIRIWPDGETYTTVVDEREMDVSMGDGVVEYLRGETDA